MFVCPTPTVTFRAASPAASPAASSLALLHAFMPALMPALTTATTHDPRAPWRARRLPPALLAAWGALWLATAVAPADRALWLLESALPVSLVALLVGMYRAWHLSDASYLAIAAFLALHLAGAHWGYADVPLGRALQDALAALGARAGLAWGTRNPYDRVVHLAFGLCLVYPLRELLRHHVRGPRATALLALAVVVALGGAYEVLEWGAARLLAPDAAASFVGAQGDQWDAQQDLALAGVGAGATLALVAAYGRRLREALAPRGAMRLAPPHPAPGAIAPGASFVERRRAPTLPRTAGERRAAAAAIALATTAALALGGAPLAAQQADALPRLSPVRVGAQVVTGVLGTPVGFFGVGVLTDTFLERLGREGETASRVALAAGWTGATLVTAAGPALVGARGPGSGRYPAAVGGAAAGLLVSWAAVRLVDRDDGRPPRGGRVVAAIAAAVAFAAPGVGATLAYDASRRP